ncbi:hypothetical protein ACXR05_005476, partial [Escherichia coli]
KKCTVVNMSDINFGIFFIIAFGFITVGSFFIVLIRFFERAETILIGHLDLKSKAIIYGVIILFIYWTLKFFAES